MLTRGRDFRPILLASFRLFAVSTYLAGAAAVTLALATPVRILENEGGHL